MLRIKTFVPVSYQYPAIMKNITAGPILTILIILLASPLSAQTALYQANKKLFMGFGIGSTYQVSDIKNSTGAGFNIWLGSQLTKKENTFLALDWKFRFMAGDNQAYDHRINPDNSYSNIRLIHYNYDLELGFTLNRLMENTGIITTVFLGAGITHGINSSNLLDPANNPYDFSGIDQYADKADIIADLRDLTDNSFETSLYNRAALFPTAGIFIGYRFSPRFSMGLEYKINFSPAEENGAFGINIDNKIVNGSGTDMIHFTSLGFKWNFSGKSAGKSKAFAQNTPSPIPLTERKRPEQIKPGLPEVDITIPYNDPYISGDRLVDITARTLRINSREDITVKLDGKDIDFDFSPASGKIQLRVTLPADTCYLDVLCRNTLGTSSDKITLIYKERAISNLPLQRDLAVPRTDPVRVTETARINEVSVNENTGIQENIVVGKPVRTQKQLEITDPLLINPPRISFINPPAPASVNKNVFNVRARAENVSDWQDVEVIVNGAGTSNFNFTRDGIVSLNIALKEGINRVEIKAKNKAGAIAGNTTITYKKIVSSPLTEVAEQEEEVTVVEEEVTVAEEEVAVVEEEVTVVEEEVTVAEEVVTVVEEEVTVVEEEVTVAEEEVTEELELIGEDNSIQATESIRINPGNSDWQFCLLTPSGTFNRDHLKDPSFSYSGTATSIYIMPTGGGGLATVNGNPYKVNPGQYYLFAGTLTVTVSNKRPGAMGQWSVTIISSTAPLTGKGNKRPKSPCEK